MAKEPIPAEAREISYEAFARPVSETAANAHNRLYKGSGEMRYRVVIANGSALSAIVVTAATGDEAAEKALARNPGCKVANVSPASEVLTVGGADGATLLTGGVDALDAA